jgi:hypothetical protein
MTDSNTKPTPNKPDQGKEPKLLLQKDIRTKWDKFSEIDVGALKSEDDLVLQIVAKYGVDQTKAEADATALLNGRTF